MVEVWTRGQQFTTPWPLGHTAVIFEHIYRENIKNWTFYSRFRTSKFQTIFQRRRKKTNKLNTITRFSIFHKPTGFIKMDRLYVSLSQNLILWTWQSRSVAIELISAIGHVNFAMPRRLWWYTLSFDHSKIRRHLGKLSNHIFNLIFYFKLKKT